MYRWLLIFLFAWGSGTFDRVVTAPAPAPGESVQSEEGTVTSFDVLTGPIGGSGSWGGGG